MKRAVSVVVRNFVRGLLALLPLLVTVYLVLLLSRAVGIAVGDVLHLLPKELRAVPVVVIATKVAAAAILFGLVAGLGVVVRTMVGRGVMAWMDKMFSYIPGLATVYTSTRQVVEVVSSRSERFFDRPVLVEYPSLGVWAVAFDTGRLDPRLSPKPDEPHRTVFIPTTPNPTSGVLVVLPEQRIRILDLGVEEAMKLILTGGVVKPDPRKLRTLQNGP